MAGQPIDTREFRNAMGTFATGVTVVGVDHAGVARGMTVNAFLSLSLSPPLVVVCIDEHASMHSVLQTVDTFSVNVLAHDQEALSRAFAVRQAEGEQMAGFPYRHGGDGAPILDGVLTWAECRVHDRITRGDHMIVVGHVQDFAVERPGDMPLLFFGGRYRGMEALPPLE